MIFPTYAEDCIFYPLKQISCWYGHELLIAAWIHVWFWTERAIFKLQSCTKKQCRIHFISTQYPSSFILNTYRRIARISDFVSCPLPRHSPSAPAFVVVGDFSVDGNERTKERTNGGGTKASLTSNAAAVPPAPAIARPPSRLTRAKSSAAA